MTQIAAPSLQRLSSKPQRVLIVGGCYAGLAAAVNLLDLCEARAPRFDSSLGPAQHKRLIDITIVDERDGFYHVIGSPLALAASEYARKAWTKFSSIPGLQHPSVSFVHGSVQKVDLEAKAAQVLLNNGQRIEQLEYDYLIAASGLRRVWPVVPTTSTRESYIEEAESHVNAVRQAQQGVVVIGGGAVGIEMAAELKAVEPSVKVTLVHSRDRLLSSEPLPDRFKEAIPALLRSVGVEVITGKRVVSQTPNSSSSPPPTILTLSDDTTIEASVVINAISHSVPTSTYLPASVLDSAGYVKIKPSLQFYDDCHFAAGDIALWPGIKRCGAAMHMGFYCAYNIYQHMSSRKQLTSPIISGISDSFNDIPDAHLPVYKELSKHAPMMGLAIGTTAAAYSPTEGITTGPEVLQYMFGDDLGFSICWNYMKLGEAVSSVTDPAGAASTALDTAQEEEHEDAGDGQRTPTLSATSTESGSPMVEPQTPFDAVGNAEVTNFEALEQKVRAGAKVGVCEVTADV